MVSAASVHELAPAARGAARVAERLNPDDENNIARCIELDAAGYTRLIDLAKKAGAEDKKISIAGTLAGFALLGWPRSPRLKLGMLHNPFVLREMRVHCRKNLHVT